jgi:hypothetical protein
LPFALARVRRGAVWVEALQVQVAWDMAFPSEAAAYRLVAAGRMGFTAQIRQDSLRKTFSAAPACHFPRPSDVHLTSVYERFPA